MKDSVRSGAKIEEEGSKRSCNARLKVHVIPRVLSDACKTQFFSERKTAGNLGIRVKLRGERWVKICKD